MRIKNLCMISAMSFALLSCSDSDDTSTPTNIQGKKASITVSIKGNADTRSLAGEEAGSAEENDIKSLEFFVFNADGTYQKYFKPEDLALNNQYTFLVDAGNLTILTAVNQNLGEPSPVPSSLADFKKNTLYKALLLDGSNSRTGIDVSTGFAMAAEGAINAVEGETNSLTLSVRRLLSKIESPQVDPSNQITAPKDDLLDILGLGESGTVPSDLKWTFDGYMVINGINQSRTFEYKDLGEWTRFATASNFKTTFSTNGETVESVYSVKNDDASETTNGFLPAAYGKPVYIYENVPSILQGGSGSAATVFDKDQVVAFIIKGTFSGTGVSGVSRYWRVNLLKDDSWKIYRNSIYRVTMKDIKTVGWATPKDAEEEGPVVSPTESSISVNIEVAKWDVRTQNVDL
ncbi:MULTISPECIES: fimbrial protein [Bacteroidales]|uniref:fimbrial protein n=1 Tax=Bacteroidales TaxID=171549 RepID=UPI0005730DD8|nr:fimbrial protein [Gabonia massiliensis]KHM46083.1 hypothetical protein PU94_10145 [Coprobacter secundus]